MPFENVPIEMFLERGRYECCAIADYRGFSGLSEAFPFQMQRSVIEMPKVQRS